jgi:hypothetical protein
VSQTILLFIGEQPVENFVEVLDLDELTVDRSCHLVFDMDHSSAGDNRYDKLHRQQAIVRHEKHEINNKNNYKIWIAVVANYAGKLCPEPA